MTSFASRIVYTHHGHGGICWTGIVSSCQQFEKVIFQGVQQRSTACHFEGRISMEVPTSQLRRKDGLRCWEGFWGDVTATRHGIGEQDPHGGLAFYANPGKKQVQPRWSQSNGAKCALIAVNPQPSWSRDHTRQLPRLVVIEWQTLYGCLNGFDDRIL